MFRFIAAVFISLGVAVAPAAAWFNPFAQPAPEVEALYDDVNCTGEEKILVAVKNVGSEPLARFQIRVAIFPKGRSTEMASLKWATDEIIAPSRSLWTCLDIHRDAFWDYPAPEAFVDAVYRPELVSYEYGQP